MNRFHNPSWLAIATLATPSLAQFRGFGPGSDGYGNPSGFGNTGFGFDIDAMMKQRSAHGILASVAFVVLLPLGAIAVATLSGRGAFWVHSLVQMVGWILFIVAAVLGFLLLREVRVPGSDGAGSLIYDPETNYHPIIGIVLLILLLIQPLLGLIHHRQFKVHQRRTIVSHMHLLNGRLLIILGIVNGGLGLKISNASDMVKLAYTIVAAVLGGVWLVVTVLSEVRKMRERDIWGKGKASRNRNGKNVRLDRIDKAARADSEDGRFGGWNERFA